MRLNLKIAWRPHLPRRGWGSCTWRSPNVHAAEPSLRSCLGATECNNRCGEKSTVYQKNDSERNAESNNIRKWVVNPTLAWVRIVEVTKFYPRCGKFDNQAYTHSNSWHTPAVEHVTQDNKPFLSSETCRRVICHRTTEGFLDTWKKVNNWFLSVSGNGVVSF